MPKYIACFSAVPTLLVILLTYFPHIDLAYLDLVNLNDKYGKV